MTMSLEDELIKLNDIIEDIISKSQKKTVVNYAKTLENLRTEVRRLYDKYADSESRLSFNQIKDERLYELENKITANLTKLYTGSNELIKTTLNNVFVTTVDKTINAVDRAEPKKIKSLIAIKKELDIDKTVNEKMAGLHWASRMGHHRSNVIYNVNTTIKANLSKGSTYKEMSDTLSKALNGDVLQPMRIIRTESARVYSSAKMQSLDKCRQSGVDMVKIWHSSKDERVRSQHREMDGAVVDYDDVFTFPDGITTKAPCKSGAAHHDIHCRCFITVDLKEFYQDNIDKNENSNYNEIEISGQNNNSEYKRIPRFSSTLEITNKVKNGEISLKLSKGHYEKHIEGTKAFEDYKKSREKRGWGMQGILDINEEKAQELISRFSGKGIVGYTKNGKSRNVEKVNFNEYIGYYIYGGEKHPTTKGVIHYSKRGSHIVPIRGEEFD